jgi:ATP-dependent RNA helicase DDX10/DBP4
MAGSRKEIARRSGKGTKLRFDDEGVGHQVYDLVSEAEFKAQGPVDVMQRKFVEETSRKMAVVDDDDREEDKEKKRLKWAKREEASRDVYE